MSGTVVEVVDGKTVVIQTATNRMKAELQFIETPAQGQPMFDAAKEHLRKLVFNKFVSFRPKRIHDDRTSGQLMLDGVDLSQQMLRDGAVWHVPARISAQEKSEFDIYASLEAAAKAEKRGLWVRADLKPSWLRRDEELAKQNNSTRSQINRPKGKWGDVNPKLGDVGALYNGYNAASKTGYLSTGIAMVTMNPSYDERFQNAKLYVDITYWYKEGPTGRTGRFVLTLISENDAAMFRRDQQMLLIMDNARVAVGRGARAESRSGGKVFEKLTFNISRSNMEHMAKDVTVMKIADHLIEPLSVRYIFYNMLQVAG
jgi:endonuclease YncB( thermonuclease family)